MISNRSSLHAISGTDSATVFVVDDDPHVRQLLRTLIGSIGLRVEAYASAEEFLDCFLSDQPGCLLVDMRMPTLSGLQLQERMLAQGMSLPVILLTGYADVATAVRAMRNGALDVIEKPFNNQALLERIQQAIAFDRRQRQAQQQRAEVRQRLAKLTRREAQVLQLVVAGKASKQIAFDLSLSEDTIEVYRARIRQKMQAQSLADLVRMALKAGVDTETLN